MKTKNNNKKNNIEKRVDTLVTKFSNLFSGFGGVSVGANLLTNELRKENIFAHIFKYILFAYSAHIGEDLTYTDLIKFYQHFFQ